MLYRIMSDTAIKYFPETIVVKIKEYIRYEDVLDTGSLSVGFNGKQVHVGNYPKAFINIVSQDLTDDEYDWMMHVLDCEGETDELRV